MKRLIAVLALALSIAIISVAFAFQTIEKTFKIDRYGCSHGELVLSELSSLTIKKDIIEVRLYDTNSTNTIVIDMPILPGVVESDEGEVHYKTTIGNESSLIIVYVNSDTVGWLLPDGHMVYLRVVEDKPKFIPLPKDVKRS